MILMVWLTEAITRTNPRRKLSGPEFDHYWMSLSDQAHGQWDVHRFVGAEDCLPQYRRVAEDNFRRPCAGGQGAEATTADLRHDLGPYPRHHVLPQMQHCDSVLDVQQTRLRSLKLGSFVTLLGTRGHARVHLGRTGACGQPIGGDCGCGWSEARAEPAQA